MIEGGVERKIRAKDVSLDNYFSIEMQELFTLPFVPI
jgi:hypothetical protein